MGYGETRDVRQALWRTQYLAYWHRNKGQHETVMVRLREEKKYVHFSTMLKLNSKSMVAVVIVVKRNVPRAHSMIWEISTWSLILKYLQLRRKCSYIKRVKLWCVHMVKTMQRLELCCHSQGTTEARVRELKSILQGEHGHTFTWASGLQKCEAVNSCGPGFSLQPSFWYIVKQP